MKALKIVLCILLSPIFISISFACLFALTDLGVDGHSKPLLYTGIAFVIATLFFTFVSPFMPVYVFGHELTHWILAKLFRRKTGEFKVGKEAGHVEVTNPNIIIFLGPYIIPIYAILWLIIYRIALIWYQPHWHILALFVGLGISYAFHCVLTVKSLKTDQPDLHHATRVFSFIVIIICNALILYFLVATLNGKLTQSFSILWNNLIEQWKWLYTFISGFIS
jgi:hypothetical protein